MLVAVNYSHFQSQCYIKLPFNDIGKDYWVLHDLISGITYGREGTDLQSNGLYLDEPAWRIYVFSLTTMKD
jgi:hypothetical protein